MGSKRTVPAPHPGDLAVILPPPKSGASPAYPTHFDLGRMRSNAPGQRDRRVGLRPVSKVKKGKP